MTSRTKPRLWHGGRFWLSVAVAWALVAVMFPGSLLAQQDSRSVRAAFVYNLTKYVDWPVSARELNICVLGGGGSGAALKLVVDGKVSDGKVIHVLLDPPEIGLGQCEIIYCTEGAKSQARPILGKNGGRWILTVGEDDKFVRDGGMIGFVRTGDSMQIEVNLESVKASNLKISSRLLDLAVIIRPGKRGSR